MSGPLPPTRTDRLLHRLRDHPVIAVVIVLAITTIGIAQLARVFWEVGGALPVKDTSAARTYTSLKYDLQDLDRHIEGLNGINPALLPSALSGAGEKARAVCEHEPKLVAMDDDLAVRTVQRACPFADAVDTVNALFATYPHRAERPDADVRDALLLLRLQAEGIRTFLHDSAGRLLGDESTSRP